MTSERNIPHLRDIFGGTDDNDRLPDELSRLDMKGDDRNSLGGVSAGGTDSAISVGSASEEDLLPAKQPAAKKKRHKSSGGRQAGKGAASFEDDVKHLERHLSMKKTIRKKIMRDLQQAFVADPDEFKVEDIPPEQLKAELNSRSLSFGTAGKNKKGKMKSESNFLDFLRGGNDSTMTGRRYNGGDESDSGHGSPTRELEDDDLPSIRKPSFWRRFTIKGARNKR